MSATKSRLTTLVAVQKTLKGIDSEHTALFTSLVNNGKNSPLKCAPSAKLRFGTVESDMPQMGMKPSPFAAATKLPTLKKLQEILTRELKLEQDEMIFFPPPLSEDDEGDMSGNDAATELINNLTNPMYKANGIIVNLPCPLLDEMCTWHKEEWDTSMSETPMACSVFPSDTMIPIQHHNETTSFSTLLSGEIIWIIWPPTEDNLHVMQSAYEAFAGSFEAEKLNVAQDLVGGLACVQSVGEGLRVPPYCIMLGLVTKTSVLATYSLLPAHTFVPMLRKIPFLDAWWKTEIDGEQKRIAFGHAVLELIESVVSGTFESYHPSKYLSTKENCGPLHDLLTGWDAVKDDVAHLVEAQTSVAMRKVWKEALYGFHGRSCAICGQSMPNKRRDLGKHFDTAHWPNDKR